MSSIAKLCKLVKYENHIASGQTQTSTAFDAKLHLPNCFTEHHAPRSVVNLFTGWVRAADETDGGVIVINRQRQLYNATTVDRAVKWLTSHHLLFLTERGGGRGNGNRYFVRWSFTHETLSARQNAVNHPETAKTLSLHTYAHEEALKLLEESLKSEKHSFDKSKTPPGVLPVENWKRDQLATENRKQRRLRNEKATRWAMARLREATDDPDALTAAAKAVRQALRTGQTWIGPELAQFVALLADDLESLNDGEAWPETRRDTFSYIGFATWSVGLRIYGDRRNEAEFQARQRERQEAIRDPLPTEFSCRSENGVATPSARRRVVRSDSHERRQRSEPYQRRGDLHSTAKSSEYPATVYAAEPVNVADMVADYLERLGGGDGVDEVAGNDDQ